MKEQPRISSQIREDIKKRRELNRRKRNVESEMEKEELEREYINQKYKAKFLVKEAITIIGCTMRGDGGDVSPPILKEGG